jgi:hypothetical protein
MMTMMIMMLDFKKQPHEKALIVHILPGALYLFLSSGMP